MLKPGIRAEGVWRISGDEPFLAGHFPDRPIVPGVLLSEALAQLSGLVAYGGNHEGATPPLLAQINIKLLRPVAPPAEIDLQAEWARSMGLLSLFNVEARCGRNSVAHGSLTLTAHVEPGP